MSPQRIWMCFDGANFSSTTGKIPDIYSFYDYFAG